MSNDALAGLLALVMLFVFAYSLFWVYEDAQAHGKTGCLWALIALFTWPLGVLAYYFLRNKPVQL